MSSRSNRQKTDMTIKFDYQNIPNGVETGIKRAAKLGVLGFKLKITILQKKKNV